MDVEPSCEACGSTTEVSEYSVSEQYIVLWILCGECARKRERSGQYIQEV